MYDTRSSMAALPITPRPTMVAVTLARMMGEKTRSRNSRRRISIAKMAPAMGALNEAAMPAPAPLAIRMDSSRRVKPRVRPTSEPNAAPP